MVISTELPTTSPSFSKGAFQLTPKMASTRVVRPGRVLWLARRLTGSTGSMATRLLMKSAKYWAASILAVVWLAALGVTGVQAQGKSSGAKIRLGTPSASLSYLPIHVALQKGFFARRGLDVEVIQMAAGLVAPALLNRAIDYTTVPSGPATAAARGAPLKVICFAIVKLQHLLISRPEIMTVTDLAGKRIGAGGFGTLSAYEVRVLIDRYRLGPG